MLDQHETSKRPPELVLTRTYDAPRRLVFEAWTKPEHVARWFTPRPLATTRCEVDLRTGGAFRITMRMPNGTEHPFDARFVEVVPPSASSSPAASTTTTSPRPR